MEIPKYLKAYSFRCDANEEHNEILKEYYLVNDGTNNVSGVVSPREVKELTSDKGYSVRIVPEGRTCPLCQDNSHKPRGKEFLDGLVAKFRTKHLDRKTEPERT